MKDTQVHETPRCPSCGGTSFSFQEVFGPPAAQKAAALSYSPLRKEESRVFADLHNLERQLKQKLAKLEDDLQNAIDAVERDASGELESIAEAVESELSQDNDEIMQVLMGEDEKKNITDQRQSKLKQQVQLRKDQIVENCRRSRTQLTTQAANLRVELREHLTQVERTFVEANHSHTLALVFCLQCGIPVGTSPSARVHAGLLEQKTDVLQESLQRQTELTDASNQALAEIKKVLVDSNIKNLHAHNQVIQALATLASAMKGVKVASTISALADLDEAQDQVQEFFGGGDD